MIQTLYLEPAHVQAEALAGLHQSYSRVGLSIQELESKIWAGELKVFVIGDENSRCYTAVSVLESPNGRELEVGGLWVEKPGSGWRFRTWLWFLKNLAMEWGCDKVTTAVNDARQLRGLLRNGCKVDYIAVSLEVRDGQQDQNYHN